MYYVLSLFFTFIDNFAWLKAELKSIDKLDTVDKQSTVTKYMYLVASHLCSSEVSIKSCSSTQPRRECKTVFFFKSIIFPFRWHAPTKAGEAKRQRAALIWLSARVDKVQYVSVDQSSQKTFTQKTLLGADFTVICILRNETFATRRSPRRRLQAKNHQRGPLSLARKKKKSALSWTRHEVTRGRGEKKAAQRRSRLLWKRLFVLRRAAKRSGSLMAPCPRGSPAKTRRLANQSQRAPGEIMAAPPVRKQGLFFVVFFLSRSPAPAGINNLRGRRGFLRSLLTLPTQVGFVAIPPLQSRPPVFKQP